MVRLTEFPGYPAGSVRPVMKPEGNGSSGILCVGEAPGEHEEKDGLPFRPYAEAGSVLERALYRAGISRESLTITNLVWYRPPRNWLDGAPWADDAIRACQPLNDALIERVRPRVILALGGMAFRELTGMSGPKQGIEMCRGFIVPALSYRTFTAFNDDTWEETTVKTQIPYASLPVVGTYHPSYLRRGSKERTEEGPKGKTKAAGGGTQGMNLLGVLIRDLQLAQDIAKNGAKEFKFDDYRLGGTLDDWHGALAYLRANPDRPISYDFETQDSLLRESEEDAEQKVREVTQVQISWRSGQALVSPWFPELLAVLREIIQLPNPKIDWNGRKFDRPILREMMVRTDIGEWHDGMDLFHHAQPDLPRGLQFATSFFCPEVRPWKHMSHSEPLYYGALDVDMPQRIFSALKLGMSLQREPHSGVSLWGDGKYGGYTGQVLRLAPALDRMSARGIPVDETKRNELDIQFTRTLLEQFAQLQGMVPDAVKGVHVYKKAGTKEPCQTCAGTGKAEQNGEKRAPKCLDCGGKGTILEEPKLGAETTIKIKQGTETREVPSVWTQVQDEVSEKCDCPWAKPKRKGTEPVIHPDCPKCLNSGKILVVRECWAKVEPFLPGSPQQVMRYIKHKLEEDIQDRMAKYLNRAGGQQEARAMAERLTPWKVPTDHKTGQETTSEMELRRLADKTQDQVLPLVLDYREISKLRGTYVQGWKPGPDGRVHPTFGFKPATAQLSSENPNAQNFVQHSELAHSMLQMIMARTGRKMVKFDWKSFHAVTAGFEAQDPDFIRIARIDIHAFLTLVGLLKLERPEVAFAWKDAELKDRLKWYRKQDKLYQEYARQKHPAGMTFNEIRDEMAKRVVYGWEFGQGPRSLYILNQESFRNESEAGQFQDELRRLFSKIDKWQMNVKLEADKLTYLATRYGFVRRFFDVFQRKPVADNYQPRGNERLFVNGSTGQKWLLKPGDDAEACVAFRPANDAFGIKRERLVMLREREWDEKYCLISETHDDFRFECEDHLLDEMIPNVQGLMEQPSQYLVDPIVAPGGLWCGVEAAVGKDWDSLEKIG